MVDRIRKVVENECYLGPITLFLGAETAFFGRRTRWQEQRGITFRGTSGTLPTAVISENFS
jgi:hypothetical protein